MELHSHPFSRGPKDNLFFISLKSFNTFFLGHFKGLSEVMGYCYTPMENIMLVAF